MVTTGLSVADVLGLLECRLGVDGVRLDGKDDMQMHCLQKAGAFRLMCFGANT